jgi:hypothetical protein
VRRGTQKTKSTSHYDLIKFFQTGSILKSVAKTKGVLLSESTYILGLKELPRLRFLIIMTQQWTEAGRSWDGIKGAD